MFKQGSNLGFSIIDHVLVLNTMYPARQNLVPVVHKLHIVAIVISDACKIVGERLPTREELLETGKTRGHRMTTSVNNFGVGQNQMN